MKRLWSVLRDKWCYAMHPAPMWPVNGFYRCPECQREYPVPWETTVKTTQALPVTATVTTASDARSGFRLIKSFRRTAA
jgi:hypothetical protein